MNTAKDAHLTLIGAEALASFDSGGEGKILANLTSSHILIRDIPKELLLPLVSSFREKHRAWLIAFLTTLDGTHRKRPSLSPEGGSMAQNLYGLASRRDKSKDGLGYRFSHIRLNGIPDYSWASIGLGDVPPRERTIRALRGDLPHSLQKKLVMAMVEHTDRLESLFLNPTYLWFPELEAFFDGAKNGRAFIEKVISAAERNRGKENRTNDATTNEEDVAQKGRQNFIPSMFLLWLALNHVILLPPRMAPFLSGPDNAGLAMALLTQEQALHFNTLKEHFKDYQDKSTFLSKAVPHRMELSLFTILSSTTFRSATEATPELFAALRDCSESENTNKKAIDFFKRVYEALNATLGTKRKAAHFPNRGEIRRKDAFGFSWVHMRRSENNDFLFPAGVPNDYTPNPGILWWVEIFELHLKTRHGKAQQGIRTSIQSFLVWLAKTNRTDTGLHSIKREDIHDPKNPHNNTYRQHLEDAKNTNNTTKNQYLRLMHSAFETLIAEAPVPSRNPIIPDIDLFPEPRKRTTTKRNAIPRKIAALLRDLNSRDDFALSKGIPEHHVLMRIPVKLDSDSTPSWTRIPEQAGQSERSDAGVLVLL